MIFQLFSNDHLTPARTPSEIGSTCSTASRAAKADLLQQIGAQMQSFKKENDVLKEALAEKDFLIGDLRGEKVNALQRAGAAEQKLSLMEARVENLKGKHEEYEQFTREMSASCTKYLHDCKAMEQRAKAAEQTAAELKEQLEAVSKENEEMKQKLAAEKVKALQVISTSQTSATTAVTMPAFAPVVVQKSFWDYVTTTPKAWWACCVAFVFGLIVGKVTAK